MRQQIYAALLDIQGERADALIDFGFSLYGYEAMVHQVLVPVLVKVGDAWEQGKATVAQEHYMTHMISNRLSQFFTCSRCMPIYKKVIAFCPAGEHHQIGLLLFSLFLRRNGVEVIYLGSNTPRGRCDGAAGEARADRSRLPVRYEWHAGPLYGEAA
ncbi:B12-binding domain-containing protein [Paenibacillus rhizoplanae]